MFKIRREYFIYDTWFLITKGWRYDLAFAIVEEAARRGGGDCARSPKLTKLARLIVPYGSFPDTW